ncbi:LamG-like jellyroll fold domain-containing protein, partial [Nocardioides sp.]|uniref:LamG-like jellyroll fold domain-containing protein n=1 Tax=Nocardioides sp. TaxID=35761 RepID=UPI002D0BABE2
MNTASRPTRVPVARWVVGALCAVVGLAGAGAVPAVAAPGAAAPGDGVVTFLEVEDGVISGNPGYNQGDHSNFTGAGSYTFRETGMRSTMTVNAPAAGLYPVYVRYAAGPLSAAENVTRSMGLVTNGVRQQLQYPLTGDWETWRFVQAEVMLLQGANTIALDCDRSQDICRLNFDAIQLGGTAPDPCAATAPSAGFRNLFDGTLESFDRWRKAGAGGFGRQADCTIRSFRGRGAEWLTEQQTAPYTLKVDWRRAAADDESSLYLASSSRGGADPVGGLRIPIGTDTGAVVPTGGTVQPADRTAVARALRPVGQWNRYVVQLTTTRVKVYLNGSLVNTYDSAQPIPTTGFIGLENRGDGHTVDFKNIQIADGVVPDPDGGVSFVPVHYEFEEGVGTAAANTGTDSSVGPATLTGTTGWSPDGVSGSAVNLPGGANANAVDLPDNLLQGATDFTTSFWARPDTKGNWIGMFHLGDGFGGGLDASFFQIQMQTQDGGDTGLAATFKGEGSGLQERVYAVPKQDVAAGAWNHVVFTRDDAVGTLYLNGQQVASRSDLTIDMADVGPTTNNWLGRNGFPDPAYDGLMDDVRLYKTALSGSDVAAMYADGTALDTTTTVSVSPASPSPHGQPITVSATVADEAAAGPEGAPDGQAELWIDGARVGAPATVTDGAVTFPEVTLSPGAHQIEVRFIAAAGWNDSSAATQHTVQRPPPSTGVPVHYTFDEGQGTTAANSGTSTTVGPATLTGSASWAAGHCAGAVSLPGGPNGPADGSSHVNLPNDITAGMDAEITVSTWLRPTALPGWTTHVQIGKSTEEFLLVQSSTFGGDRGFGATLRVNGGQDYRILLPGETDLPLDEWTHVVVTLGPSPTGGGTTGKIYFDGVLMEGGTRDNIPVDIGDVGEGGTTANFIGNTSWNDPRPTELVDEFRIYGYELNAQQVAELSTQCPPVNRAPAGAADAYGTDEGTPLTVQSPGVLANDTDADNDPMTTTGVAQPANGAVTMAADGGFTYTPATGFAGTDTFTYRTTDGRTTSTATTVTITVEPAPAPPAPPT